MYSPTTPLTDPPAESPIADGIAWVQGAALGSTATTIAVFAVAAIGLLMLSGRLELRRGITVVIGCFILFGADDIAAVLTGLDSKDVQLPPANSPDPGQLSGPLRTPTSLPTAYDPYAGASVPTVR